VKAHIGAEIAGLKFWFLACSRFLAATISRSKKTIPHCSAFVASQVGYQNLCQLINTLQECRETTLSLKAEGRCHA